MIKIAHLALACLAANGAAQDAGHRKLPHIMTFDGAMEALREAYDTDGPDADPCDLFREPTCLRVHKKHRRRAAHLVGHVRRLPLQHVHELPVVVVVLPSRPSIRLGERDPSPIPIC